MSSSSSSSCSLSSSASYDLFLFRTPLLLHMSASSQLDEEMDTLSIIFVSARRAARCFICSIREIGYEEAVGAVAVVVVVLAES